MRDAGADRVLLAKGDGHIGREGIVTLAVDGKGRILDGKRQVGRLAAVHDAKGQARAAKDDGLVVVETGPDRIIPLENLIAARQDRPGTLFARVTNPNEARLCATLLQVGVHGILLSPANPQDILAVRQALDDVAATRTAPPVQVVQTSHSADGAQQPHTTQAAQTPQAAQATQAAQPTQAATAQQAVALTTAVLPSPPTQPARTQAPTATAALPRSPSLLRLVPATVTAVTDVGVADRACLDSTSLLARDEGMLVGSMAHSLALVLAEASPSAFLAARPFRVNAGAVHSYVLAPDGTTNYLSEVASGMRVAAVTSRGDARDVTVGRVKVERRPHVMVAWDTPGGPANAVLQNAETIRLARPDGSPLPVTAVRPGDAILVHASAPARHGGIAIAAAVEER